MSSSKSFKNAKITFYYRAAREVKSRKGRLKAQGSCVARLRVHKCGFAQDFVQDFVSARQNALRTSVPLQKLPKCRSAVAILRFFLRG
jgi:hypothetical protein